MVQSGILFIVSAPSGAGKTTLCRKAVEYFHDLRHSISYTTRLPRNGETDGVDYHFISKATFQQMIERGKFLEWAEVHGNRYGTSYEDIQSLLANGLDIILDIDVQGARQVKKQLSVNSEQSAVFIFILPPSLEACEERIRNRGKDSYETIVSRLENARNEIKELVWYEYVIINDKLENAFERLKSIIVAERNKRARMMGEVKRIYSEV
ncbi:MAG: guanylate kinase, partial [Deltaproteobacteria bacterium]|nr:guanylate kinase [Deltaproteobacteria bacterium]